ncbi:MAG: caspase family protein [Bacteroidota bacterium]
MFRPVRVFSAPLLATLALLALTPLSQGQPRSFTPVAGEPTQGGERVALVIGNASYTRAPALKNPKNDASDMREALTRLGFHVVELLDGSRGTMEEALATFRQRATGAEVALVFYAGHGVEVSGANYFLPVEMPVRPTAAGFDMDNLAIPLTSVLDVMALAETQVVILDACRDNPFDGTAVETSSGGYAEVTSENAILVYGTAPGDTASDNADGRNGLFTEALLAEIHTPGLEIAELMRRVKARLRERTRYMEKPQDPWLALSAVLPFYFVPTDGIAGIERQPVTSVATWARDGKAAYLNGTYGQAEPLLLQAAEAGHVESQYLLGRIHLRGYEGAPSDAQEAAHWFSLASQQGLPGAQYFLAGLCGGGWGCPRDDARAADLYQRAAEQGLPEAQYRLGVIYEAGDRGRPQSLPEAIRWYRLAAEQGYNDAREALERLARSDRDARSALSSLD